MELTDKSLEAFNRWYIESYTPDNFKGVDHWVLDEFHNLPESMQYGVYVDFFDSVGLMIDESLFFSSKENDYMFTYSVIYYKSRYYEVNIVPSRQEAQTKAIEKANELLNDKLNQDETNRKV